MKTTRMLALPAIAAAAVLSMTGCFQLPGAPTTNPTTTTTPTDGGGGGGETVDLAGTTWSGTDEAGNPLAFTLAADGTVDFETFGNGGPYDEASDTWSVNGTTFEMYVSNISDIGGLTYTGTAATGSMQLTGVDDNGGTGYDVTITQG